MKRWMALLFLAICLPSMAVEQVTLTIAITNGPVTGDTLTINGATRTWTNAHSSTTILTNLTNIVINHSSTNLYFNVSAYPLSDRPVSIRTDTNAFKMVFPVGTTVSASQAGNWCDLTYATNNITQAYTVRVPISIEAATNQTNIASMLVTALQYSTNAIFKHWSIAGQLAALTNNNAFTGTNSLADGGWNRASITNLVTLSGSIGSLTNGYSTNLVIDSGIATNLTVFGQLASQGSGLFSVQLGSNAVASGGSTVAVGQGAVASATNGIAIGRGASATAYGDLIIGRASEGGGGQNVIVGNLSTASKTNGIVFGNNSINDYTNTVLIGNNATASAHNQIQLGDTTHLTSIPGRLSVTGTQTNSTFTGSSAIGVSGGPYGTISISRYNNTGLANGDNLVDVNGSSYVKVSGPTATFAICNVTNGAPAGVVDGMRILFQNSTGYTMQVKDQSGTTVGVAANRIYTGTGSDISITNNPGYVEIIYDSAASRWGVIHHSN